MICKNFRQDMCSYTPADQVPPYMVLLLLLLLPLLLLLLLPLSLLLLLQCVQGARDGLGAKAHPQPLSAAAQSCAGCCIKSLVIPGRHFCGRHGLGCVW
jgi:ABC-type sulfate transport system permease component